MDNNNENDKTLEVTTGNFKRYLSAPSVKPE